MASRQIYILLSKRGVYLHFHACPECAGRFVVPRIHNTTSDMFAFRSGFFDAGGFANIDRQFGLGPAEAIN